MDSSSLLALSTPKEGRTSITSLKFVLIYRSAGEYFIEGRCGWKYSREGSFEIKDCLAVGVQFDLLGREYDFHGHSKR